MEAFDLSDLEARHRQEGRLYHEFLRVPAMSAGLYVLPAGGVDPQQPHAEDEVYFIIGGRGQITVAGETRPVQAGTTVYVPARVDHRFHDIQEDLSILVLFAPAETGTP